MIGTSLLVDAVAAQAPSVQFGYSLHHATYGGETSHIFSLVRPRWKNRLNTWSGPGGSTARVPWHMVCQSVDRPMG